MIYQTLGLVLIIAGWSHLIQRVVPVETRIVRYLQSTFQKKPMLTFFQDIWFFGRTIFAVITLSLLTTLNWKQGLTAISSFLVIVGVEQLIKLTVDRPRPFSVDQDIDMLQPVRPHDSSFPSGDALRIWYLAIILPHAAGSKVYFLLASILLACLVTIGRIIMGVHYPTDTITGTGLGLFAAGINLWLWQYLGLL